MSKTASHQSHWAQLGATVRLQQLRAEIAEIYAAFPALRRTSAASTTATIAGPKVGRKRRKMSKEARAKMSEGMRRHWLKRKTKAARAAAKSTRANA